MSRFGAGEIIYTTAEYEEHKAKTVSDVLERLKSAKADDPSISGIDKFRKMIAEISPVMDTVIALDAAGWVKTEPDGIRLVQKNDPEELPVERRVQDADAVDRDTLKEFNLTLHDHIYYGTEIRLVIDPRIHIACTADEVEEALEGLEVDEEGVDTLLNNLNSKSVAINSVLSAIRKAGKCSIEDLIEKMDDVPLETEDSKDKISAHFSEEYVTSLVNDLRKIGLIEGNDRKLRAVR